MEGLRGTFCTLANNYDYNNYTDELLSQKIPITVVSQSTTCASDFPFDRDVRKRCSKPILYTNLVLLLLSLS